MKKISMQKRASIMREAARRNLMKNAGPLTDVSHLRHQAVFMMGAPGSGKGFVSKKLYLKYMPGAGPQGSLDEKMFKRQLSEQERSLSNLEFEKVRDRIEAYGFEIKFNEGRNSATIPFHIHDLDTEDLIPRERWEADAPEIYDDIKHLEEVVFTTPVHELPTYWRVVDPDMYKHELIGFRETLPGYVHEMSSEMSKAYFEAAVETGDPLIVDGTGAKPSKYLKQMEMARANGYSISLVWVYVPLVGNIIRNSTRTRVVNTNFVTSLFKAMGNSWSELKGMVDKAKVFVTFSTSSSGDDAKKYLKNKDLVDGYVQEHTGFPDLYTYMMESPDVPRDQKELASKLRWLHPQGERLSPKEQRMKELRERLGR
jgi:hypothetical protein